MERATAARCRESNPIVKQSGSNPSSRCKLNKSNCKVQNLIHCCSTLRRAVLYGRGKHNVESLITLLFFEHSTLASSSTPLSEQLLVKLSVAKRCSKVQCPFFSNRELPLDVVSTITNVLQPLSVSTFGDFSDNDSFCKFRYFIPRFRYNFRPVYQRHLNSQCRILPKKKSHF